MTEVTSITLFKTDEGFELRFDGRDIPKADQRTKVPHLRGVVQVIRKAGLEMTPSTPTNVLGPPMPQGEVDELMEAQTRADAAMAAAGELAPHTADLGEHVERLREARPEFHKKPLPGKCVLLSPLSPTFPLLVRADPGGVYLNESQERVLNIVQMAHIRWPDASEPLHMVLDRSKPIEVERDGLSYIRHRRDLRGLFQ